MKARTAGAPAKRSRPRNRKAQIVSVAAELFHRQGYHTVTMDEIANAVGITAGALYRHFHNKQELLARTVLDGLLAFETLMDDHAAGDVDGLLRAMAALTLDRRDLGVLWQRESRHLPQPERDQLRHRFRSIAGRAAATLTAARPGLGPADADFLVWAIFATFASSSHHSVNLPRARFEDLLHAMGTALAEVALPPPQGPPPGAPPRPRPGLARASRREALIDAAARLFGERGYQAVSMEDIGAAAGISGAGIYNHVTAKSDLLVAALTRAADALQLDASRAFAAAADPRHALDLLLRSYIDLTVGNRHLTGALITEVIQLPAEQRHTIRRLQHDYVSEWVHLLTAERPELTEAEARVVVHAVLTTVNDLPRIDHLRERAGLRGDLLAVCRALLRAPAGDKRQDAGRPAVPGERPGAAT